MDKAQMIQMHLSGMSNRKIAQSLGVNRKTVDKYIGDYRKSQAVLIDECSSKDEVRQASEAINSAPQYQKRKSSPRKWNAQMDEFLDQILTSEDEKRKHLRTSKQQLTKTQIHELMVDAGFDIGVTTVCKKINEKRNLSKEAFIAQHYRYGQRFEYDFGEVRLFIAGRYTRCFLAVMSAPASGYRFAYLYPNQRFEAFVDSQVRFFEKVGGCFEEGVYDNMRNVVAKFTGKGEKLLNERLLQFSAYYGFKVVTTNAYSGNEKGSVENAVKVIRNKAFSTLWSFESFNDAQIHLAHVLEKLNADKSFEEEQRALSPYRPPYEIADIRPECMVNKYSCVCIDKVFYSVPDFYVGKKVLIKAYPTEIFVYDDTKLIAHHPRSFAQGEMVLDISHYLKTFERKPAALANSSVLAAHERLYEIFHQEYSDNPKEFISILLAVRHLSFDEAITALQEHVYRPIPDTPSDAIEKQTLEQIKLIGAIGKEVA